MARHARSITVREIVTTVVLVLAILWLSLLLIGIIRKEEVARQAVHDTRAEIGVLDERRQTLAATVNDLDTERGKDASLRETYGVAKPGEDVIVVVPKKEELPPPPVPFWQKVMDFLHL